MAAYSPMRKRGVGIVSHQSREHVSVKSSHPSKERVTIAERRRRSPVYSP